MDIEKGLSFQQLHNRVKRFNSTVEEEMKTLHSSPKTKEELNKILKETEGNKTTKIPATIIEKQDNMVCYYLVGKEWSTKEFTANKTRYCIGSSSHDSEIGISEPEAERVQVVVQKVGNSWFVMEHARTNLLHINGIPNFQFIFEQNGYCYVKLGNSKLVLVKGDTALNITKEVNNEHKFVLAQGDTKTDFNTTSPCLIGTNPCSDFVVNKSMLENNLDPILEEPFLAIINSYNNQLFIDPISEKFPLLMKGRVITESTPICKGSTFSIGELEFSITESTTVEQTGDFIDFSAIRNKTFMLLQVLGEEDSSVVNIELPKPGKAVTIGRGKNVTYTISDLRISKQHIQLIIYEKSVLASDLSSTNGTFVNDEKIKKKLMHAGDFLSIGDYIFFLCYNDG